MGPGTVGALVGRGHERDELAAALVSLRSGSGGVLVIEGEPGIGKTRLLFELAHLSGGEGCAVLSARASELGRDLPYALWSEAIEPHLASLGERRVRLLGLLDPQALAGLAPGMLAGPSPENDLGGSSVADRHRVHRALRDLLGRLATTRALVICLDDVHWADPASLDALAALVRRPPAAVLLALAAREGQLPVALSRALAAAMSEDRAARIEVGPLSKAEAGELLGKDPGVIFSLSGGNPFYLQQLVRVHARRADGRVPGEGIVPAAVAASLASELGELSQQARLLLEAAAVAGDPFEPELAAEVAQLSELVALQALDDLLARSLVRPAEAPRRFAFRHPLVRHAVYASAAGGWRLAAHARAHRRAARARLPALWMLARSRRMTGDFAGGLADLKRGLALAAETERETVRLLFALESVGVLAELGRLKDADEMAGEGVELARPGAHLCCYGRSPRSVAPGWQRATSGRPYVRHVRRTARAHGRTSARPGSPAGASDSRWPPPASRSEART